MSTIIKKFGMILAMLLSFLSGHAYDFEVDGFYYEVNLMDMTASLVSGETKYEGKISVPSSVSYKGREFVVTSINGAFSGCSNLLEISIPDAILTLGQNAFSDCTSLNSVVGMNGVTEIADNCFYNCSSLQSLVLPYGIKKIGANAFQNCTSLKEINLPTDVISIGSYAFSNCKELLGILLPPRITTLSEGVFSGCESLSELKIPNTITIIEDHAFQDCKAVKEVSIPASVSQINNGVFSGCKSLMKIVFEESSSTISIGYGHTYTSWNDTYKAPLFEDCPLEFVFLGRNIKSASGYWRTNWGCFSKSTVRDVNISSTVTFIEEGAFIDCTNLESINIPASVINIGEWAFSNSGLTSIKFEDGYQNLTCSLCVSSWDYKTPHTFSGTKLSTVYIGRNLVSSGGSQNPGYGGNPNTFLPTTVSNLAIGNYVTNIDLLLLNNQKITSSLSHYSNLQSIKFGININKLPSLSSNEQLTSLLLESTNPPSASPFSNSQYMDLLVEIPEGAKSAYEGAAVWKNFWQLKENETLLSCIEYNGLLYQIIKPLKLEVIKRAEAYSGDIIVPSEVKYNSTNYEVISVGEAFSDCNNLKSIVIPESVNELKANSFKDCGNLASVKLNGKITEIPISAFENCSTIDIINVPQTVIQIRSSAFKGCSKLSNFVCPPSLESIGESAFESCTTLSVFSFNSNIKSIGKAIFKGCINIESINIPSGISTIPIEAFSGCSKLNLTELNAFRIEDNAFLSCTAIDDIILPNIVSIGNNAFKNCTSMSKISFGSNLKSIGDNSFSGCKALVSFSFPQSLENVGLSIFSGCASLKEIIIEDGNTPMLFPSGSYDGATNIQKKEVNGKTIQFKIQYYNGYFSGLPIEKLYIGRNLSDKSRYTISGDGGVDYYLITSYDAPFSSLSKLKYLEIADCVSILGPKEEYISEVDLYSTPGSFKNCSNVDQVIVKNEEPPTGAEFSSSTYAKAMLIVPDNTVQLYQVADGWKEFISILDESSAGIEAIEINYECPFRIDSNGIVSIGETIVPISIYCLDGRKIYNSLLHPGETVSLNSGIYILKLCNKSYKPQIRNFVCCGLMGWDLIRLVMPMAGIELQIAADVHSYPLPHDAA